MPILPFAFLSALLLNPSLPARAEGVPVHVLVEDAASPWSDRNGVGMANDLVRAAFAAAGAPATLDVVPYARCKALVLNGAAPSCLSMSDAPELRGRVRFADQPLFSVTPHFYSARGNAAHRLRSLDGLRPGMRVGIVFGYEYPPAVAALAGRGVTLETARSEVVNLKKLAAGRLDLAVLMTDELRSVDLVERQAGVKGVLRAFTGPAMGSFIGFSTSNPEGERQRRLFNTGFKTISENGQRQRIEAHWRLRCARFCPE